MIKKIIQEQSHWKFFIRTLLQTRYSQLADPERSRIMAEEFLEKVHLTDAILLYGPSQVSYSFKFSTLLTEVISPMESCIKT